MTNALKQQSIDNAKAYYKDEKALNFALSIINKRTDAQHAEIINLINNDKSVCPTAPTSAHSSQPDNIPWLTTYLCVTCGTPHYKMLDMTQRKQQEIRKGHCNFCHMEITRAMKNFGMITEEITQPLVTWQLPKKNKNNA